MVEIAGVRLHIMHDDAGRVRVLEGAQRVRDFFIGQAGREQRAAQLAAETATVIRRGGKTFADVERENLRRIFKPPGNLRLQRVRPLHGNGLSLRGRGFGGLRRFWLHRLYALDQRTQLQAAHRVQSAGKIAHAASLKVEVNRRAAVDRGQKLALARLRVVVQQALLQRTLHGRGVFQRVFQRAVLGDQLRRGFFAHAGHAGNVVGAVAHQSLHVDHLRGRYTVLLLNPRGRHALRFGDALFRIQDGRALARQLIAVAVAGDNQAVHAGFLAQAADGAQNVVGLVAAQAQLGDVHAFENFARRRNLRAHFLRRGRAAGLVGLVAQVPEGGGVLVEGHGAIGRLFLREHLEQHRKKAVYGVGVLPLAVVHQGKRVERAIQQAVSVHKHDFFRHKHPPSAIYSHSSSIIQHRREKRKQFVYGHFPAVMLQ